MTERNDGRSYNQLRPFSIERNQNIHAEGSALVTAGNTRVLCLASLEARVPPFLKDSDRGWVTAEYALLPRATHERNRRERNGAGGRTLEIQRLIARSLRAVVDLHALRDYTITVDCDVLQADGGTRCASITGAYVALYEALRTMVTSGQLETIPIRDQVAAVSVGIVDGTPVLDLNYHEDSSAEVDMNIVMTSGGKFVEIQGTAEAAPFGRDEMNHMLDLAGEGLRTLFRIQRQALEG